MSELANLAALAEDPDAFALLVFGGGVLAISLITMLGFTLLPGHDRQLARRIQRVQSPAATLPAPSRPETRGTVRRRSRDSSIASLDRLVKRMLPDGNQLRLRLERSGLNVRAGDYLLGCLGLGVATLVPMWLATSLPILADVSVAVLIGVGVPHLMIGHLIRRRVKQFTTLLPEALDLIVRGIRSGLPATEAMNTIGTEIADPLGTEFRRITDQVRIGVNLNEAMWGAARRLQVAEFNFLVISLAIQQETGGNLAEILEKLSDMVRRREQMRLKIRAMSSEARASAIIIGALPFIMCGIISFINPGYMSTLFTDPRGWIMIGMGLTSLVVGLLAMAKMVRFEI